MKLEEIYIKNYRSINELKLSFVDDINLLIGPNGCGKTNILDAINHCFEAFIINNCYLRHTDTWFGIEDNITISATVKHINESFKIEIVFNKEKGTLFESEGYSKFLGFYKYIRPGGSFEQSQMSIQRSGYNLHDKFQKRHDDSRDVFFSYFDMHMNSPYNLEDLSKEISKLYPDLKDIYVSIDKNLDSANLIAIINNFAIPVHLLASGLQQLIRLVADIYYSKNNLILIDEPSLHMNPKMVVGLSDLIKRSSKENGNQFIIGTHSPILISTLNGNIISLDYGQKNGVYTTFTRESIPDEFLNRSVITEGD